MKTDKPIIALNGKVAGLTVNTRAGILEDPPIKLRGETPIYGINGTPVTITAAFRRTTSNRSRS